MYFICCIHVGLLQKWKKTHRKINKFANILIKNFYDCTFFAVVYTNKLYNVCGISANQHPTRIWTHAKLHSEIFEPHIYNLGTKSFYTSKQPHQQGNKEWLLTLYRFVLVKQQPILLSVYNKIHYFQYNYWKMGKPQAII